MPAERDVTCSQHSSNQGGAEEPRHTPGQELAEAVAHFLHWSGWLENRHASSVALYEDGKPPVQCGTTTFLRLEQSLNELFPGWHAWNEHYERVAGVTPYGRCPHCSKPGVSRERRINGNDKCESGHVYPSKAAQ